MQHMDLWFDLAMRGEPDLEEDVIARLHLSDAADLDPHEGGSREAAPLEEFFF
ncbi:MAG TPA: hypothetical protein VET45_00075 [Candidatus Binatia bacterium]|nr:hypothetical protein [Candidatus Binatia bacterium]